ncbi:MAG TPA: VWA domain-containing protein [Myxococcota bacterium]|nr:VWA domain-containing protein [Myxococcota bacterium]
MIPASFHFLRPLWLLAIPAMLPLLWLALRSRAASSAWQRVCDPELLEALLSRSEFATRRWPGALLALGWTVACVAAAGPTWEQLPQPAYHSPSSAVLVVNLSPSMDATDVAPSRLGRARFELTDALAGLADEQLALVIFSEEPYTVTPLADDPAVIGSQVPVLATSLMPGHGTRVDRAIDHAAELLERAGAVNGRILLISDGAGDEPQRAVEAAERAAAAGVRVSVLGVGTEEGAPLPARRGFARDQLGNPITVRLERDALEKIARAGHGRFALATADDSDLHAVMPASEELPGLSGELTPSGVRTDVWRDMGAALLAIPLLLAPFAFRKGWASTLLLVVLAGGAATLPAEAHAAGWDDLWSRPDQQGARALADGRPADAAKLFQDPAWRAAALYRAQDYAGAAEAFGAQEGTEAKYNLGNALARAGQLEQALGAYDQALAAQPDHADARFNRDLVAKLLEQQKQDPQQKQDEQKQSQEQQQQQQNGQQPQDQQQQPSQEQQSQEQQQGAKQDAQEKQQADARNGEEKQQDAQSAEQDQQQGQDQGQEKQQPEQAAAEREEQGDAKGQPQPAQAEPRGPQNEKELALEQWLNRIPDDPGGLLREKLRRQYAERRYGR